MAVLNHGRERGQPRQLLHHSSLAPIARLLDERDTVDDIQLDFTNIAVGEKDAASDGDDATVASGLETLRLKDNLGLGGPNSLK